MGVELDEKLKFDINIGIICDKVARSIGVLYKIKPFVSIDTLISLYYSLIYPYLHYCNLVWGSASYIYLERLFLWQKRAVRIICNANYLAHTDPLFLRTKILKIFDIHKLKIAIYMFNNRNTELTNARHDYETRFEYF